MNERETDQYKTLALEYDNMPTEKLTMMMVYQLYRAMKYQKAKTTPDYPGPSIREYALDDAVLRRLKEQLL
jgi:hypothetical protein